MGDRKKPGFDANARKHGGEKPPEPHDFTLQHDLVIKRPVSGRKKR